jgi:hypothetical protein
MKKIFFFKFFGAKIVKKLKNKGKNFKKFSKRKRFQKSSAKRFFSGKN